MGKEIYYCPHCGFYLKKEDYYRHKISDVCTNCKEVQMSLFIYTNSLTFFDSGALALLSNDETIEDFNKSNFERTLDNFIKEHYYHCPHCEFVISKEDYEDMVFEYCPKCKEMGKEDFKEGSY